MAFWQLTINARDPAGLARFWALALDYVAVPPTTPDTTWWRHYGARLGDRAAFEDRLFDPEGLRPPLWFQYAPDAGATGLALHVDVYPTGRDASLTFAEQVALVEGKVEQLVAAGGRVQRRTSEEDPDDPVHFVTMTDPEGNVFCVS